MTDSGGERRRWRHASWWLGLLALIWPIAAFADWMLCNAVRRTMLQCS